MNRIMKTIFGLAVATIGLLSGSADALNIPYTASPGVSHRQIVYKKTTDRDGRPVTLKYRIYVHDGDAKTAQVARAYQQYLAERK